MKIKIAENIRKLRKEHKLTQEQLAETLGVTVGAVYKWEAGLSTPEIKLIMEMADFFEISVDVLLGYEQQRGHAEERVERITRCIQEMNFEDGVLEAEKALKKYPNHFEVVYVSATMYQCRFTVDRNAKNIERSNELYKHALSLVYQNTDGDMNEATIQNRIAENYLLIEKNDLALELLKENNMCGINNNLIGFIYATVLKQPKEARPYLIKSFADNLAMIGRTMLGLANMYHELKDEKGMETLVWLMDFLNGLKIDKDAITFLDKITATLLAQYAVWKAEIGEYEQSEKSIKEAYSLGKKYDEASVHSMKGIRFLEEEAEESVAYDDMGKTAMEAIQNVIIDGEKMTKGQKFIQDIWEVLQEHEKE